jgi:hypothetical protein
VGWCYCGFVVAVVGGWLVIWERSRDCTLVVVVIVEDCYFSTFIFFPLFPNQFMMFGKFPCLLQKSRGLGAEVTNVSEQSKFRKFIVSLVHKLQ